MFLERYSFEVSPDHCEYEFYSVGPKGKIRKLVHFEPVGTFYGENIFNLSLCDWNERTLSKHFDVVTNNDDTEKVLMTVAQIALDFSRRNAQALIYMEGGTPARTRRYQIAICKYYSAINSQFRVYGILPNDLMEAFRKNVNYTGFLAKKL